ncbi:MAG: CPBP family intramembrane metalloprotease [Flavobacteriia bacterium]|nr:CPBP family intramembrane metalloprotease [Flavobacteriia bacterium]
MKKQTIYLFGWITLLLFPIPTFIVLYYLENIPFGKVLELNSLFKTTTLIGIEFGILYAFLAKFILLSPIFNALPHKIETQIRSLNLNYFEMLFLSLCAGIGEEILFRVGFQYYLGPWLTSIFFVAIHGYFNPKNWIKSLYGCIVLPFILILAFAFQKYGLWFAIGAHFAYDFILFIAIHEED